MEIVNIAAYKFVPVDDAEDWRLVLQARCEELELKGTIILASEGINLVLAGSRGSIDSFLEFLRNDSYFGCRFQDLEIKESFSDSQPFGRMVVRLAKEIITMRIPDVEPSRNRAPIVDPRTLREWLSRGYDDHGREVVMLDTRNTYETDIGTFKDAIKLEIERFSEFPGAIEEVLGTRSDLKEKTVVSYCTGGIRCEKAVLYLQDKALSNVYQLEGGILRYFEEAGGEHWQGECFVFDNRVALDSELTQTTRDYPRHIGPRDTMDQGID